MSNSTAPRAAPSPEATKARIISHMNADHHPSLVLYLEHYAHAPSFTAARARLTSATLTSLTLDTGAGTRTHTIPLDPALHTFTEMRERLVAMDRTAKAALGRDEIVVTKYVRPVGLQNAVFVACLCTFVLLHRRGWLDAVLPAAVAAFLRVVQPWVFWPMLVAHALEAWTMERSRLRRFSVPRGSRVWCLWVGSCFVEGVASFWRFDALVEGERRAKEARKH